MVDYRKKDPEVGGFSADLFVASLKLQTLDQQQGADDMSLLDMAGQIGKLLPSLTFDQVFEAIKVVEGGIEEVQTADAEDSTHIIVGLVVIRELLVGYQEAVGEKTT